MSIYDKERESLGLNRSKVSGVIRKTKSIYDEERAELAKKPTVTTPVQPVQEKPVEEKSLPQRLAYNLKRPGAWLLAGAREEQKMREEGISPWSAEGWKRSQEASAKAWAKPEITPSGEEIIKGWGWEDAGDWLKIPFLGTPRQIAGEITEFAADPLTWLGMGIGGKVAKAAGPAIASKLPALVAKALAVPATRGLQFGTAGGLEAYAENEPVLPAFLRSGGVGLLLGGAEKAIGGAAGKLTGRPRLKIAEPAPEIETTRIEPRATDFVVDRFGNVRRPIAGELPMTQEEMFGRGIAERTLPMLPGEKTLALPPANLRSFTVAPGGNVIEGKFRPELPPVSEPLLLPRERVAPDFTVGPGGRAYIGKPKPELPPAGNVISLPRQRVEPDFTVNMEGEAIRKGGPVALLPEGVTREPWGGETPLLKSKGTQRLIQVLDELEKGARQRIESRKGRLLSGPPLDDIADYSVIGAAKIAKGTVKFAQWSAEMVKDFGEAIRPYLKDIYAKAKEIHGQYINREPGAVSKIEGLKKVTGAIKTPQVEKPLETINPTNWKDKMRLSYTRETMERNIEDIAGPDAPKINETYFEPVHVSETENVRWKNRVRKEIKTLGLNKKESEALQKFGEGQYTEVNEAGEYRTHKYTLEDLKKEAPGSWQKIVKAKDLFRKIYDETLNTMNQALKRNGYPEVPRRENYFPHFQEIADFLERIGIPTRDNALPTDINGLTEAFRPGKPFFGHALVRKGRMTTLDAIQGMDRYLEGAGRVIFHTDNIKRLRVFEKGLRDTFEGTPHLANLVVELQEYTNNLAGKKSKFDRAAEFTIGRKVYGAVDRLRKQVSANMIGGNISATLTQFIPLTQSLATTNKTAFVRAMLQTIGNVFKDDGFVEKSNFLTRRIGSDKLSMRTWDKIAQKGFWPFKVIDNYVGQTIVRSKYLEFLQKGMGKAEALKRADDWGARIMADRSVGSMPTLFNSKMLNIFTQFQIEVNNQLSFAFKDIPRNFNKAGTASAIAQLLIYGYVFNNLFEMAVGRRPAFDPIWVAKKAYEDYTNPDKTREQANKKLFNNIMDQFPFTSILTGGRIPLGSALPDVPGLIKGETTLKKELTKVGSGLILPTGGMQLKKTVQGAEALEKGGVYTEDKSKMLYPVEENPGNMLRALLFGKSSFPESREYYEQNKRPLSEKQTAQVEAATKAGGNPKLIYKGLQKKRAAETIQGKIKDVLKDRNMSPEEKARELKKLKARLLKVSEQK